jgi:ribosomal protein S18 acetylase RimI-like enzyme
MAKRTQSISPAAPGRALTLRPIRPEDRDVLRRIYASTRAEELAQVDWTDAQKDAFLTMQFDAQHAYYQENYPRAAFDLILLDGQPIGRLYLDQWDDQIRIVDIALLPQQRGQGIGTALLRAILDRGRQLALPVTIHVERFNPALRLYDRLGFRTIEDKGVYLLMEWSPRRELHVG